MTYFPDCRKDEYYNQKYLDKYNNEFIAGYDFAVDNIDNLFNNLDIYIPEMYVDDEDINLCAFLENHPKIEGKFRECVKHWMEMERNMLITSMIDDMDEEEYSKIKTKVDGGE